MSAVTITVPQQYGWVILAGVGSVFVAQYLGGRVIGARKKFGVKLPMMYDVQNPLNPFNGYQRGHQNMLESHYQVIMFLLLGGLRFPIATSVAGVAWSVSRVMYALGYSTQHGNEVNPDKRWNGVSILLNVGSLLVLLGSTVGVAANVLGWF